MQNNGDMVVTVKGVRAPVCSGAGTTCDWLGHDWRPLTATAGRLPHDDASCRPVRDHGRTTAISQLPDGRQTVGCKQPRVGRLK